MKDDRFEPGKLYKTNNIGSVHVLPTHDKLMVLSVERTSDARDHEANYSVCQVITHLGVVARMALYYVDWEEAQEETWQEWK